MGQMTVEQWYGTIKTGLTKKLTENKEALPAGFNQQRFPGGEPAGLQRIKVG